MPCVTLIYFFNGCLYCLIAITIAIAAVTEAIAVTMDPNAVQKRFQSIFIPTILCIYSTFAVG